MKVLPTLILTLICSIVGILFFLIQRNWLVVQLTFSPGQAITNVDSKNSITAHKDIKLFYWKNEKWHHEDSRLIWDEQNIVQNLKQLIKQWLSTLQDEHLLPPHLSLESVAVSSLGNEAYLSFDRSIFFTEWPIIKKWFILESLFKTFYNAKLQIHSLALMVRNQPMEDEHLDLSGLLPIHERL